MKELTKAQREVYRTFIELTKKNDGLRPSMEEVANRLKISKSALVCRMEGLRTKGYMSWEGKRAYKFLKEI